MQKHAAWCFLVLLSFLVEPGPGQTPGFLVVRTAADGRIGFEHYEDVTLNGSSHVRAPKADVQKIDARSYNKLDRLPIASLRLRRTQNGILTRVDNEGQKLPVFPDDLKGRTGEISPAVEWKSVAVVVKKTKNASSGSAVSLGLHQVLAIVPCASPSTTAAGLAVRGNFFESIEERGAALAGVAEAFRNTPAARTVLEFFSAELQSGFKRLEDGGSFSEFLDTVRYAGFARKAFPDDAPLNELSAAVLAKRAWIEETRRLLQSLANNRNWDTFILRFEPFEKYARAFPAIQDARRRAFEESARLHAAAGRALLEQKQFQQALDELRVARSRDPENKPLAELAERARMEAASALAKGRPPTTGLKEDSVDAVLFTRSLASAEISIGERRFPAAAESLNTASRLDPNSPKILLVRAKFFHATNQLAKSIDTLDIYDTLVTSKADKEAGESVRIPVAHALETARIENRAKLNDLVKSGRYWEAEKLAAECLEMDSEYDDFLFHAGIVSAVLGKKDEALAHLKKYLERSNSRKADPQDRAKASRLIALLQSRSAPAESAGKPNWFSGAPLPENIYYCPRSLAFQPRIESIRVDSRMQIKFEWNSAARLQKIVTTFDDPKDQEDYLKRVARRGTNAPSIQSANLFFGYRPGLQQVYRVAASVMPTATAADPAMIGLDGLGNTLLEAEGRKSGTAAGWVYPVLFEHALIDPQVLEFLGTRIATGISGNSYFNPFVWDGLHVFRFEYDKAGRVESAREIGADNLVRFEWDNDLLKSLTAYEEKPGRQVYRRSMNYENKVLTSETVEYQGKSYKISYKSQEGTLHAAFTDNGAHDGYERHVRFLP